MIGIGNGGVVEIAAEYHRVRRFGDASLHDVNLLGPDDECLFQLGKDTYGSLHQLELLRLLLGELLIKLIIPIAEVIGFEVDVEYPESIAPDHQVGEDAEDRTFIQPEKSVADDRVAAENR